MIDSPAFSVDKFFVDNKSLLVDSENGLYRIFSNKFIYDESNGINKEYLRDEKFLCDIILCQLKHYKANTGKVTFENPIYLDNGYFIVGFEDGINIILTEDGRNTIRIRIYLLGIWPLISIIKTLSKKSKAETLIVQETASISND
jgi:hypothetical protein